MRHFILGLLLFSLSGCIYTNVKVPLDEDVSVTKLGKKTGKASMKSIFGLLAWGDASTEAAARDGFMTTINHLDVRYKVVLFGLYTETTTIAYGD